MPVAARALDSELGNGPLDRSRSSARRGSAERGRWSAILPSRMTATTTVQLRPRGSLTLPRSVRRKYRLADGDAVDVVDLDGVLLLVPRGLTIPRLAAEMERLRRGARVSLRALGGPARSR